MRSQLLRRGVLLAAFAASLGSAQQFPLQMVGTSNGIVATIANQSNLVFAASVGKSQTLQVVATYAGSGKINVPQAPQVFGSTEFTATLSGKLPLTLSPGDSLSFSILFKPTSASLASAI